MFIRRTTIKSRESGEPYYTYRLVESVRMGQSILAASWRRTNGCNSAVVWGNCWTTTSAAWI